MKISASESRVQAEVRLAAASRGNVHLFRNNTGVLEDTNGRPVRFGLANDSKALNAVVKSGDLIGWEVVTITHDMVGQKVARFLSVECKPEDWKPSVADDRENAQRRWADMVNRAGGRAIFATGPNNL